MIVEQVLSGAGNSAVVYDNGQCELFGSDECGKSDNKKVSNEKTVSQVECGDKHTAVLYDDGTLSIFGNNEFDQSN